MALARDPLPESAFQPRRVADRDDDGSGRFSVMMVIFVALLAAAFVCATLKAGVQNEPAQQPESFDKLCAMTSTAPQKLRGQVPRVPTHEGFFVVRSVVQ